MPDWMRYSMLVFLVILALMGYRGERTQDPDSDLPKIAKYPAIQEFADLGRWYRILNPGFNRSLEYQEVAEGSGEIAACGQKVAIQVTEIVDPETRETKEDTFEFVIGEGPVEALDRGVRGMKVGGERNLVAGARLINRDEQALSAPDRYYTIKLTALSPVPSGDASPLTSTTIREGFGNTLNCGAVAALKIRLRGRNDAITYDSGEEPIIVQIGKSELGHGIDRGVVGMVPGEIRQLMIPPVYQPKGGKIPFPKKEIAIVEVMRIAYKEPGSEPSTEDAPHEPDSEQTERDQTVTDDRRDDQSSGAESSR